MRPQKLSFSADGQEEEDKQQTLNEADEENESDSDSDSESEEDEGTAVVPPKKPKLNPPHEEGPVTGEEVSECSSPSASGFIVMPAAKPSEKKTPFSKKFSEEDEIALLKGLAVFWADGRNNKWTEFYNFIKDNLPHQITRTQVSEKIRRLKTKFENNYNRARPNRGVLDISDAHESTVFEMSKTLWGEDKSDAEGKTPVREDHRSIADKRKAQKKRKMAGKEEIGKEEFASADKTKAQKKRKMAGKEEIGKEEFASAYPLLSSSLDEFGYPNIIKEQFLLIGREQAQELEEKWRDVKAAQLSLELKRIDLIRRELHNQLPSK